MRVIGTIGGAITNIGFIVMDIISLSRTNANEKPLEFARDFISLVSGIVSLVMLTLGITNPIGILIAAGLALIGFILNLVIAMQYKAERARLRNETNGIFSDFYAAGYMGSSSEFLWKAQLSFLSAYYDIFSVWETDERGELVLMRRWLGSNKSLFREESFAYEAFLTYRCKYTGSSGSDYDGMAYAVKKFRYVPKRLLKPLLDRREQFPKELKDEFSAVDKSREWMMA